VRALRMRRARQSLSLRAGGCSGLVVVWVVVHSSWCGLGSFDIPVAAGVAVAVAIAIRVRVLTPSISGNYIGSACGVVCS
jgi:hypothetical protein